MEHILPVFLFLSVATAAFFSFATVAVWSRERRREREAYYRGETLKKITESQAAEGKSALDFLEQEERNRTRRRREGLKLGGLVTVAIGISMMILIGATEPGERDYLAGFIPLLIGLALLLYTYFLAPKE